TPTAIVPTATVTPTGAPSNTATPTPDPCAPGWQIVPSPNQSTSLNGLFGVAAVSSNDVWAVGHYANDIASASQPLIEHWEGTIWSIVTSPHGGSGNSNIYGVAAVSSNDVWAVGGYGGQTLVEHWDGTAWSIVPSPNQGTGGYLYGVTAVSSNDVWAVGSY